MTLFSPQIFCGMSIKAKSTKVESRTQCSRPRPRTQKKIQGQGQPFRGQTFSRPRTGRLEAKAYRTKDTGASSLQKKIKIKGLQNILSGDLQKKVFKNFFLAIYEILTIQKILLSSSRGQGNFRGLEASKPRA